MVWSRGGPLHVGLCLWPLAAASNVLLMCASDVYESVCVASF